MFSAFGIASDLGSIIDKETLNQAMDNLPLKDIHLPQAIGLWPLAPGWWLLACVAITLPLVGYYLYRRLTRKSAVKSAQAILKDLANTVDPDPLAMLNALSSLLRRVAISCHPRDEVASLHGEAWLLYLDRELSDKPFSTGVGRCLADVHYRRTLSHEIDLAAVLGLCDRWLKCQARRS